MKKTLFAIAALFAGMSASAQPEGITAHAPVVPWGAQAELIITSDLTHQDAEGKWRLTEDAQKWVVYERDGVFDSNNEVQQTNRANVWYDIYSETGKYYPSEKGVEGAEQDGEGNWIRWTGCDDMILTNGTTMAWGGYLTVTNKAGSTSGLIVVGKARFPHFYVTGTDKAKFYFSGSAGTKGYPQIEVYEAGSETPVIVKTGDFALTKSTWDHSTLLIADGLDKAKSYEIVCRTMALNGEEYTYEGGDIVLQVVKLYGDQASMREDGLIISGSEIGSYINQHLAAYPNVTEFTLEGSGKYTITEGITTSTSFSLTGNAAAPATIDASALAGTFLSFSGMTTKVKKADESESDYFDVPAVNLKNVKITGLAQSLMGNSEKTMFGKVLVDNVNVELIGSKTVFALGNGYPEDLQLTNSTFWSKDGHTGFLFQSSGKAVDIDAEKITSWAVDKCTFFQVSVGKKMNNSNTFKGKAYLHISLTNSIFVNTGSNVGNEINGWLFGQNSTSPTFVYENNTYWKLAAATEEVEAVSEVVAGWTDAEKAGSDQTGTSLTTEPFTLANALAGNFKLTASSQQAKYMTGDPRWKTPYATDAIKIEVDQSENTDFAAVLNEALQTSEQPSSITIQFFEAGEYPLTQAINTTAPITIQNGSDIAAGEATIVVNNGMTFGGTIKIDGVNLKAGDEFAEPFITLQGNEYQLQDNGFYNFGKIQLLNLKVSGLKGDLIYGNKVKNLVSEIETKNCIIETAAEKKILYNFNGGGVVGTWNFTKSTMNLTNSYIYSSQSGQKATEAGLTQQTFNIQESTISGVAAKAFQHRQSGQTWLRYILKKSIIVINPDKPNFVADMNGSQQSANPVWDVDNNSFMQATALEDGSVFMDASDKQNTGDEAEPVKNSLSGTTNFKDMAAGDFTIEAATEQAMKKVGDPRWLVDFVSPFAEFYGIVGDLTGGWENDVELTMTKWGVYEVTVADVNIAVVKEYKYKLRANKNWEGYQLPMVGDNIWTPEETGMYELTFTADVLNNTLNIAAVRTGDAEMTYTVAGCFDVNGEQVGHFFGEAWKAELAANDMTKQEDGTYMLTFENVEFKTAGTIWYKVCQNHAWDVCYGMDDKDHGNAEYIVNGPCKVEKIIFTFNPAIEEGYKVGCEFVGVTTGISTITAEKLQNVTIYNLNGQRVQNAQKGLYIMNGKKVVVK